MKITLLERLPGVWRIRKELPRLADGKRQFATETLRGTAKDAEKRKTELLAEALASPDVAPAKITLLAYVREWIANRRALGQITQCTAEGYSTIADTGLAPHPIGAIRLDRLVPSDVQRHLATLSKTYAPRTVLHHLAVLRAALAAAEKARLIRFNSAGLVTPPKQAPSAPRALDDDALRRVLAAAEGDPKGRMVRLALHTGLRRGELAALTWADIDMDAGLLRVRHSVERLNAGQRIKGPKSAAGLRTIPLAPGVLDMLRAMRLDAAKIALAGKLPLDTLPVFPGSKGGLANLANLSTAFRRIADKAGLPSARLHDLRHSFVTHALREGVPLPVVRERAGHSTTLVTMGIYAHVLKDDATRVVDPFQHLAPPAATRRG